MLSKLNQFYESQGIEPRRFRCASREMCAANSPKFTEAKVSFVGPCYGQGSVPRLLFLSLDSGSSRVDPQRRIAAAVRCRELGKVVEALRKTTHWYRTNEMARDLLRQFLGTGLEIVNARLYFAHMNSAKCCQNKPGRAAADKTLFNNCRRFVPRELNVLRPDVIVTQGHWARVAVRKSFEIRQHDVRTMSASDYKKDADYETGIIELGPKTKEALWLHTHHPSAYGHFYPQRKHCWPCYARAVGRFWQSP